MLYDSLRSYVWLRHMFARYARSLLLVATLHRATPCREASPPVKGMVAKRLFLCLFHSLRSFHYGEEQSLRSRWAYGPCRGLRPTSKGYALGRAYGQ